MQKILIEWIFLHSEENDHRYRFGKTLFHNTLKLAFGYDKSNLRTTFRYGLKSQANQTER